MPICCRGDDRLQRIHGNSPENQTYCPNGRISIMMQLLVTNLDSRAVDEITVGSQVLLQATLLLTIATSMTYISDDDNP